MKRGDRGPGVAALQRSLSLAANRTELAHDGDFGPATEKAVRDLQRIWRLEVDGVVGPKTKDALMFLLGRIERGEA
jgi:peptidoglycan hydrolase-like protein with peptidoglycan-binding domain